MKTKQIIFTPGRETNCIMVCHKSLQSVLKLVLSFLFLCSFTSASASSVLTRRTCDANPVSSAHIAADLRPVLSKHAVVVLPDDQEKWSRLTARSSGPKINPGYLAIVEVAAEEDVQNVVSRVLSTMIKLDKDPGHFKTDTTSVDTLCQSQELAFSCCVDWACLGAGDERSPEWNSDQHAEVAECQS